MSAGPFETQDQAISAWNRRAADGRVARLVEAAEKALYWIDQGRLDDKWPNRGELRAAIAAYRAAYVVNRASKESS